MKRSTGLRVFVIGTGSLRDALTGVVLRIYSGTVPDTADAALNPDNVLLCTVSVSDSGQGVTWEQDASSGALVKSSSEVWLGSVVTSGTASFFRASGVNDPGDASTGVVRLQGTVGVANTDLVTTATFTQGDEFKMNGFVVSIPAG